MHNKADDAILLLCVKGIFLFVLAILFEFAVNTAFGSVLSIACGLISIEYFIHIWYISRPLSRNILARFVSRKFAEQWHEYNK